ncbi:hypothetical protein PgNI_10286 [Pyricularia grisea]|uniref:Uncharacterized protein n=1 Tax=Pyricularia grisea TaxID=148305 RepID=A0A6P8AXV4_PYRGI|nr:hypothetical protein PgNI_10286 [Pyricularia grisea]TLD07173.1 hypothetical protein PgNI_10286 [Pyricularia grisea]
MSNKFPVVKNYQMSAARQRAGEEYFRHGVRRINTYAGGKSLLGPLALFNLVRLPSTHAP